MDKQEMTKEIGVQLASLREHAEGLAKLCDALQTTIKAGDVNLTAAEDVKKLMEGVKPTELKASLDKTFKTLKARAIARVKEL